MKKEALTLGLRHIREAARADKASYRAQALAENTFRQIYKRYGSTKGHMQMLELVDNQCKFEKALYFTFNSPPDTIFIVGDRK